MLSGTSVRLAPLYDISSVAPYPERFELRSLAMAMAINGKYRNALITRTDWRALADATSIDRDELTSWVRDVVTRAPDALADVARQEGP